MQKGKIRYYPTTLEAIHLLVLFIFLQSLIDFPLALYDYYKDTNWLANPWINFITNFTITAFIYIYGFRKTQNSFKNVFALKVFNPLVLLPVIILLPGLQYLVGHLNERIDQILPPPPWFWELFERVFENRFGFWGVAFKVAVFAPIVEESLFRGIIMHGLMRNYKKWYAVFLSALLFSLFHLNPWQMSYTFFLGLLLGWLMVRTRSLPLTILVHSINNLLVLLSITYTKEISENALVWLPRKDNVYISILAIALGILLIIAITMKKRKNQKPSKRQISPNDA